MSVTLPHEHAVPDDWVPVDRRWLGLDRRTIPPAIVALVVIAIIVGVLPAIDRAIDYDRQVRPGDTIDLGSGLMFTPPVGWEIADGLLVSETTVGGGERAAHLNAAVLNGATQISVKTGTFSGTNEELLDQAKSLGDAYGQIESATYTSETVTVTTESGRSGVAQGFVGTNVEGIVAVFVIDEVGVEFVVQGPPGTLQVHNQEITDTVESLAVSGEVNP